MAHDGEASLLFVPIYGVYLSLMPVFRGGPEIVNDYGRKRLYFWNDGYEAQQSIIFAPASW